MSFARISSSCIVNRIRTTKTPRIVSHQFNRRFHPSHIATMKAYYYDDQPGDPRLPHISESLSSSHLEALGVLHTHIPLDNVDTSAEGYSDPTPLSAIATRRSYKNADTITVSPAAMGDVYETKIKTFFEEHMHEDEEIRYILEGSGYFDVREKGDGRWVRIQVDKGDLLVLPPGVYHRFTTNEDNYIKARRLFKDEPKWTPLNRSETTDVNPFRKEYLVARDQGFTHVEPLGKGVTA